MSEIKAPLKAIRAKCLDCCCGQANEVKLCPSAQCPLHAFRNGKNPYRTKKELTPEEKEALATRLKNAREKQKEQA